MTRPNARLDAAHPGLSNPGPGKLNFRLIDDATNLAQVARSLRGTKTLYLDTEFVSRREGTELGLIQIGDGKEIFLVDAVRLTDLSPLVPAFDAEEVTWVLHAGLQDLLLLTRRLGLSAPRQLFDTQVVWALVTLEYSVSLAYLKYRVLGVRGEKAYQTDDWIRRPLPSAQLAYAAEDVAYLPQIYQYLLERCAALGRTKAAYAASLEVLQSPVEPENSISLENFRNAWQLEPEGQAVLRFLIDWYNGLSTAERSSAPDSKALLAIAGRRPGSIQELGGIRAVPQSAVHRHGRELLQGVKQATRTARDSDFVLMDPAPYATATEILTHGLMEAVRAEVSVALGIAPELAFPARLTRRMRETATQAQSLAAAESHLTGWRALLVDEFRARANQRRKPCVAESGPAM